MRPFFLTSPDQFRPAPPPAFGSPDYLAALAEVRSISDTRTADQVNIALSWAKGAGQGDVHLISRAGIGDAHRPVLGERRGHEQHRGSLEYDRYRVDRGERAARA